MIDVSFLRDEASDITPYEYKETELKALTDLAKKVGLYEWIYDTPADGVQLDGQTHIGPILQDVARVEGLGSAVSTNEQGLLEADTRYIALAALAYVAALTRVISRIEYEGTDGKL